MSTNLNLFNPARGPALRDIFNDDTSLGQWTPRIDLSECNAYYQIKSELPGLKKEDIKITFENNVLNISGEKFEEKGDVEKTYHRVERIYGKFSRSISLGNDVDPESIEAEYKNGLLEIKIQKKSEVQPKQININ